MIAPAALLLAASLSAPLDVEADAALRLEARSRSADQDVQREDVLTDLAATPALSATVQAGPQALHGRYAPSLTLANLGARTGRERRLDVVHEGLLRYTLAVDDHWRLGLSAGGARGRTNLVAQGLRGATPPGTVPTTGAIDYQRGAADLELFLDPTRRSHWVLRGGIYTSGGTTADSRLRVPVENSLAAGLDYRWNATRRDDLGFSLAGRGSRFPEGGDLGVVASGLGTWHRRLKEEVVAGAGGGATWLYAKGVRPVGGGEETLVRRKLHPAAMASLTAGLPLTPVQAPAVEGEPASGGDMLRAEAVARLGAGIDRLTAEVSQQLDATATLAWERAHGLTLAGRGYAWLAWQRLGRAEARGVELRAGWAGIPHLRPEVGFFLASQEPAGPSPSFLEYGLILALTIEAPHQSW